MTRSILALGPFDPADPGLAAAVGAAGGELRFAATPEELAAAVREPGPEVVLAHLGAARLEELLDRLRDDPALEGAPLLAVLPETTLEAALRAVTLGADDFLAQADLATQLPARLAVATAAPQTPPPPRGRTVLLADSSPAHGQVLARLLGQAGFETVTVADGAEAERRLAEPGGFDLVILDFALPGCDPTSFLGRVSERRGSSAPPGIGMFQSDLPSETAAAALAGGFRHFYDARRPADELIFLANECTVADQGRRAAPRLPCAVLVRFRTEGGAWQYGLSHNVSVSGLYVRTLIPPPEGTLLEIELTPPGATTISARAAVAWCKPFAARADRSMPTGMGLQLADPEAAVQKAMAVFALGLSSGLPLT